MQVREKVGKSRNTVFFHWFVAPEDPNVGSLKRRVRSQLAKWEMKNCTPLGREAHFQVKMYKTSQLRTTFGSWDVEKVHAVVARSTFPSQNVQNISAPDHFWKLRCRKNAHRCGAKHLCKHEKAKNTSNFDVEKIARVVAGSTFPSQNVQNISAPDHFWKLRCRKNAHRCGAKHISKSKCEKHHMQEPLLDVQMPFRVAGARDCGPCQKVSKPWRFCSISKNDGRRGTFEEDLERCIFRGKRSTRDMFIRELLGGPGADFLRGVAFWSLRSSGLLRWFCVTGAALRMTR